MDPHAPLPIGSEPRLLRGGALGWPASGWSFEQLGERARGVALPVHTGRWKRAGWRVARDGETVPMQAEAYFRALADRRPCGYLAGNELFRRVPALRDDLAFPDVGAFSVDVAWIGPAGTSTPAHFDRVPNLYAQLQGRKRWRLWRPDRALQPLFGSPWFSMSALDVGGSPDGPGSPDLDLVLEPGDLLVIPARWWHRVDTLDDAIAVNRWWVLERLGRLVRRLAPQK